jgi:hypothetical protein
MYVRSIHGKYLNALLPQGVPRFFVQGTTAVDLNLSEIVRTTLENYTGGLTMPLTVFKRRISSGSRTHALRRTMR